MLIEWPEFAIAQKKMIHNLWETPQSNEVWKDNDLTSPLTGFFTSLILSQIVSLHLPKIRF